MIKASRNLRPPMIRVWAFDLPFSPSPLVPPDLSALLKEVLFRVCWKSTRRRAGLPGERSINQSDPGRSARGEQPRNMICSSWFLLRLLRSHLGCSVLLFCFVCNSWAAIGSCVSLEEPEKAFSDSSTCWRPLNCLYKRSNQQSLCCVGFRLKT